MAKKVILTGLRANNDLTIGNYFGALLPVTDMAKNRAGEYQVNLFVPDLHSFTTPIDHSKLQEQIIHNLRLFVGSGLPLDNPDVNIYRQSYIPAHSELTIILNCFTGFDEMRRMTQFKDKSINLSSKRRAFDSLSSIASMKSNALDTQEIRGIVSFFEKLLRVSGTLDEFQLNSLNKLVDGQMIDPNEAHSLCTAINEREEYIAETPVSVGLFNYPVLMAADILLYNATYVPVGDDQTQHLEFARDIAQRMNSKFGQDLFTVPLEVKKQHELFGKDQGLRIMDLQDPTKKMSKSADSNKGVIFMGDTPEDAHKKVMGATTDSFGEIIYAPKERPGIANLIELLALLTATTPQEVAERYKGQTMYGPLKTELADKMADFLRGFQKNLAEVDEMAMMKKIEASEASMTVIANETLLRVQKAVGLR